MAETGKNFDLIVIGAGPGGYVAAIRAAQLGLAVACVEKGAALGGTCLNVGCIPSKALLHSSEQYEFAQDELAAHGVKTGPIALDLATMMARKEKTVGDLTKGIAFLFKKNKVAHFHGTAEIIKAGSVRVSADGKAGETLGAKNILIATGSQPASLPGVAVDEKVVLSSTGALSLGSVPGHMVVIGAGYIGLELGSVWRRLGAKVTVVEFLDRITPTMDGEIALALQKILSRQGMVFRLGHKVVEVKKEKKGVRVAIEPAQNEKGGARETLEADVVLSCVGRKPFTQGLGLEALGVACDKIGRITVDADFQSSVKGIYAVGDVIAGPMLAHKASEEGVALAEKLAGKSAHVNYDAIPGVIYTRPEAAGVGATEEELKDSKADYRVGRFPFSANPRARCMGEDEGMVKILADGKSDRVLGVHILGAEAGTLIHEAVLAMEFGASAEDIARTCHAHPTLSEAIKEAALDVDGRALHR